MDSLDEPQKRSETSGSTQRGRKKKGTESTQKTKKQAQRGMGVAKLELLRHREIMTESTQLHHQALNQYYVPCSYPGFASYVPVGPLGFNQRGLGLMGGSGVGSGFAGYYTGSGYGLGDPGLGMKCGEKTTELASIPIFNQSSDHWGLSNKKKRVSGESLGFNALKDCGFGGFNMEKNHFFGEKREEIRVKSPSLAGYLGENIDQDGEVVAMHQKGDSTVLMEYKFFPDYKNGCKNTYHKNSTDPEDGDTTSLSLTTTTPSSSSTTTSPMGSTIIFAPKPIDLSLKLSY